MTVEDASVRQLDTLYKIEKECFKEEAFTKPQISHLLTDYNSISLVAKEGDETLGFAIGAIQVERRAPAGHILTIDVLPKHRRKGIGLKLLCEVEKVFIEKGVKICHLEVREDNVPAISLYRKLGYIEVGILENYYGDKHGLYLRKVLAKLQ